MDILFFALPPLIVICIMIQGFFAASEMAMVSSNKVRLQYLAHQGHLRHSIIIAFLENPERLFGTTLVGINVATVVAAVITEYYFEHYILGYVPQVIVRYIAPSLITAILLEPFILVFGELFPMSLGRKHPDTTSVRNAFLIYTGYVIFFPLMLLVSSISKVISTLLRTSEELGTISRDELELLVSGRFNRSSTDDTKKFISDVFRIKKLNAEDIMIHLNNVVAVDENSNVKTIRDIVNQTSYSRFPVYREKIFNIVSSVQAVSILNAHDDELIVNYTDKLYIVPSSKPVIEILKEMKTNRKYMAIVVDEYGASCGIITIENIVEEIIGTIKDEFDTSGQEAINKTGVFDALTYLDDFYDATGIDFRDEGVETLSGIINLCLGRIGRKGERVIYKKVEFEILEASDKAVKQVKLISKRNKDSKNKK